MTAALNPVLDPRIERGHPSARLFRPANGRLQRVDENAARPPDMRMPDACLNAMNQQLRDTVLQPSFPCVAALRAISHDDYLVGVYRTLGDGTCWRALRQDLLAFLADVRSSASPYRTMFALFPETPALDEVEFEKAMWHELSCLTSVETRAADWGDDVEASDPTQERFVFCLGGEPLFVVGLHPASTRRSRRFPFTGLVFNAFSQFEHFEHRGTYDRMVAINRQHAVAFEGSVNPMVEQYGDRWEAIQFSGRQNAPDWHCPFRFMLDAEKN